MSDVADWWKTAIIDMEPGRIHLRGHQFVDHDHGVAQNADQLVFGQGTGALLFAGPRTEGTIRSDHG